MATLSFESSFLNLRTGVSEIGTGSAAGRLIAAVAEGILQATQVLVNEFFSFVLKIIFLLFAHLGILISSEGCCT